jgi:RNA polymerase sigma factor (sigma-70 family)
MSPSVSIRLLLTQSDERLVGYARAGHERAFEALVQRYRRQLHGYCRRLLLSDERAEDALQQALLQAWVALRDGAEVRDARPWLYRIVHNTAVNALRVSGYDYCKLSESLSGAGAPQEDLDRRIAVREALAGLAALPQMQREALLRTAVEGRSHQQVASDLGLSEPALRGLVYRARAAMRTAAGAIVPPPLLSWALEAGTRGAPALERVAGLSAGGGSAGLAGLLVKGGAVAVTAGALAGGLVAAHGHKVPTARAAGRPGGRTATSAATLGPSASAQPAAFTRSAASDTPSGGDGRSTRSSGQGGGWRRRSGVHVPRSFGPAPSWVGPGGHSHGDAPRPAGIQSGDGSGGPASRDGHGASSGASGSGPGDHEQTSGGTSLDGGASTSSGKDTSGDGTSLQTSGGGEPSTSSGGGGGTKDGSGDLQPSEPTSGSDSSTSSSTSGSSATSGSKDGAGLVEGSSKPD